MSQPMKLQPAAVRSPRLARALWFPALLLVALATAQAAPTQAPEDEGMSRPKLQPGLERLHAWTRPDRKSAAPSARASSRSEDVHALMGQSRGHVRCATDLLLAMQGERPDLNQTARMLFDRVTAPETGAGVMAHMSPDGRFRIIYRIDRPRSGSQDGNLDGVPDGVERLGAELTDALADFTHVLDWTPAPPAAALPFSRDVIDVFLVDLGNFGATGPGSIDGYATPIVPRGIDASGQTPGPDSADSRMFFNARIAEAPSSSRAIVVHQVAHMLLLRESLAEAPWWHEASALWLENRLTGNAADTARSFREGHSRRAAGIQAEVLGLTLEEYLWPQYLSRTMGGDDALIRQLWAEMAAFPGNNTLDAMDRVLRRQFGTGLAEELAVFNVWNLFIGQADDGQHYSFGQFLPTPRGDAIHETFPARGGSLAGPLSPSGSALVQILGDGSRGGLRIRFQGAEAGAWDVGLIVSPVSNPGDARYVPLTVEADGVSEISFPWSRLAQIDVLIQNLAPPTSQPAHYSFSIDHDPVLPFDLMSFSVGDATGGAVLSWSTDAEERMAGWNVQRSTSPLGPFARINRFLIPAAGDSTRAASYAYLDATAQPGIKYYYQLEGVTQEGFTDVSHPTGVRLAERTRRPSRR